MTGSIITTLGKNIMLNRAYNASPSYTAPTVFRVGVNGTTVSVTDTDIAQEIPITGTETVDDCEATTGWTGGTDTTVSLNTTIFKIGAAALNIYKSGTAGTTFSASKTVTSLDFTSKDLSSWVYVADVTDLVASGTAVSIRYGSDGSNYYQYDVDITSLSNGWNLVVFNSSEATSTTGSPVITAMDYYEIIANTDLAADTVAEGDFVIDDLKLISSDDYDGSFEAGFPSIDEVNNEVEIQKFLNSAEANGYDIDSLGIFNTDSTPKLMSHDVFTPESKSNTDEFIFITKDRLI